MGAKRAKRGTYEVVVECRYRDGSSREQHPLERFEEAVDLAVALTAVRQGHVTVYRGAELLVRFEPDRENRTPRVVLVGGVRVG